MSKLFFHSFCYLCVYPLTIAHPLLEFQLTGILTAPLSALRPLGPPERRSRYVLSNFSLPSFKTLVLGTNLDPYGEALAERFSLCLCICADMCHGRRGSCGSDCDGAVGDVLASRTVDLSISRLYGCCQGFHAVNALCGV